VLTKIIKYKIGKQTWYKAVISIMLIDV